MRQIHNNKGFTFIELVIAMAVMAILGAAVTGLVRTGLSSYTNISGDMEGETEARTAMSLLSVQLRQNDETGLIDIDNLHQILRIKDTAASTACAVIWFENGWLVLRRDERGRVFPRRYGCRRGKDRADLRLFHRRQ